MRRKDREVSREIAEEILKEGEYGTFSTVDAKGQPYAVPVSYIYLNDAVYFHCAKMGAKLDNIAENPKVCFSVVSSTEIKQSEFSTNYRSAIAFGTAGEAADELKYEVLLKLTEKYSPDFVPEGIKHIEEAGARAKIIEVKIELLTGKVRAL